MYCRDDKSCNGPDSQFFLEFRSLVTYALVPTQDTKPSLGRRPKDGFVSKWVYNFWPAKNLHTYQDTLHSFKHPIGGGQQQKCRTKSSSL